MEHERFLKLSCIYDLALSLEKSLIFQYSTIFLVIVLLFFLHKLITILYFSYEHKNYDVLFCNLILKYYTCSQMSA